jgi:hypothetical protein
MNLWLSLVIGGIATGISVSIVVYTILEEQRAKNRAHCSASEEQRKMLGAKPRFIYYEGKRDADYWVSLLNISAIHANPPSMLRLEADWLPPRDPHKQGFAVVLPKNLPQLNRMSLAVGKMSWGKLADEILFAGLSAQRVAYLK